MASTLIGIFLDAVAATPKPALFLRRGATGWEAISSERARVHVEQVALGLEALGVARGDRVALLSESRYEWPIIDLAVLGLGAVLVPVYPTLTAAQIGTIVDDAGARVLVVSTSEQLAKARAIAAAVPAIERIVTIDARPAGPREQSLADVEARGTGRRNKAPQAFRASAERVQPDDLATIIYTSGTTGEPKGAMLTHANIVSDVEACLQLVDVGPDDLALSFLPLCHVFERMAGLYAMLRAGASIAYARSMDTVGADAAEVRPTIINGVPRFYEKARARILDFGRLLPPMSRRLFDWGLEQGRRRAVAHFAGRERGGLALALADRLVLSRIRARLGGRLRFGVSGSASLAPEVMEFFFAIGIPIIEGYGLTETSPVICLNPPGRERPGSVGKPIPGVEVAIGEQGEILTRGPHVMQGYYRNETATREALRDGWFHTGDIGRFDDDGYLFITDRLKDLIVLAGGKKVAPQPIEARLKLDPIVSEAVLVGEGRPYVACLIVANLPLLETGATAGGFSAASREALLERPEVRARIDQAIERVNADLAQFEKIKRFGILLDELTQESGVLTPTLKVKRRIFAQRYRDEIERLYAERTAPISG